MCVCVGVGVDVDVGGWVGVRACVRACMCVCARACGGLCVPIFKQNKLTFPVQICPKMNLGLENQKPNVGI